MMNNQENFVKNFLEGMETCTFSNKDNNKFILSKIPLNEDKDIVGFYFAKSYYYDSLPQKFESEFVFVFFRKQKAVMFTPYSQTYYLERFLDFPYDQHGESLIADALGYKGFNQKDIADRIKLEYKNSQLSKLLSDFPDFDSLPDGVKETALNKRNKGLAGCGSEKKYFSSERTSALLGETNNFHIDIPDVDDFALAFEYVLGGIENASSLLRNKETEESKNTAISNLADYYLRQRGIEEAKNDMSENDKKKMTWFNAVSKTSAKELTVIYDAKKVAERLADVREHLGEYTYCSKEMWGKIFSYLDKHEQIVFKVSKDGFCVTGNFIQTSHTNMTNKDVFGLSRYSYIPTEIDHALDDLGNLIDIRFRNKTILNAVA